MWFKSVVSFLTKVLELIIQKTDPKNKILDKLEGYNKLLEDALEKRDQILNKEAENEEEEEKFAVDLGIITNRILYIRKQIKDLERQRQNIQG